MPANVNPIFTLLADIQWIQGISAASNGVDLTSGTPYLVFTADATNGGFARELRVKYAPGNNTAATVMRVWINNGGTVATAANSIMIGEFIVPATTASATAAQTDLTYPLNFPLPPGYKIYVTIATATGGSGTLMACVLGGKY